MLLPTVNPLRMLMIVNCTFNFPYQTHQVLAMAAVKQDLRNISKWCAKNSLLVINPEKTTLVVVGSAQLIKRLPHISLSLLGKTISPVLFTKDLGVYIDQYLTYDVHQSFKRPVAHRASTSRLHSFRSFASREACPQVRFRA